MVTKNKSNLININSRTYVQANKFVNENPDFYVEFALDSGSELSKNVSMARAAGSNRKYEGKIVKPKTINQDSDWDDDKMSNIPEKH